ncbi:hypothetical protein C0993_008888, partial [Termitomyces sp. T159_Od127]
MKLAHVLMTAAITSKSFKFKNEAKNTVLAVASLMEDDAIDKLLNSLTSVITSKVLKHVNPVISCITTSSLDFVSTNNTVQAKTTLALSSVSLQLFSVSFSLNDAILKLAAMPPIPPLPQPSPCGLMWGE